MMKQVSLMGSCQTERGSQEMRNYTTIKAENVTELSKHFMAECQRDGSLRY